MASTAGAGRPAAPPVSTPPTAPPKDASTERRLKLIIESAPCGLLVFDASGRVLAANRAALGLLGLEGPGAAVGKNVGEIVGVDAADGLRAFISEVSAGAKKATDFVVDRGDRRRTLEASAVPLQRADGAVVVLAAMRDVSEQRSETAAYQELQARHVLLESERDSLSAALEAARRTASVALEEEREKRDEAVRQSQQELQAALADAEHRFAQNAREWALEREMLTGKLRDADHRHARLSGDLDVERGAKLAAVAEAERQRQEAAALAEHASRLEEALRAGLASQEAANESHRVEHEQLTQALQELNRAYAALAGERAEERTALGAALQEERARIGELLEERELWRTSLADILRATRETGEQAQALFDRSRNIRLVTPNASAVGLDGQTEANPPAVVTAEPDEDPSWQF